MSQPFDPNDPSKFGGLTRRIEIGARPARYLFRYHAVQLLECAFCDNHTRHFRGFVVEMEDGRTALCGHKCAKDFFGEELAAEFDADLRRREKRLQVESFLAPVLVGVDPAIAAVELWLDLERQVDAAVEGLTCFGMSPDLSGAVTPRGTIDRIKEEVIESKEMGRNGIVRTVRHPRRTIVGSVRGASVLQGKGQRLESGLRALQIIRQKGNSDATKLTDNMLNYLKVKHGDAFGLIRDGVARIEAAQIFFTQENIGQLSLWCRERQANVQIRWIGTTTNYLVEIRAKHFAKPVQIVVPTLDVVPALEDLLCHLRRAVAA